MVEAKSLFHYTSFVPIYTQGCTGESDLTLFCCINYCLHVIEKRKSGNTEKGFDNCKLNNSVKRNNLINQYMLMNLKDIRQHVLVCSDEYVNAFFPGLQKTDHSLS